MKHEPPEYFDPFEGLRDIPGSPDENPFDLSTGSGLSPNSPFPAHPDIDSLFPDLANSSGSDRSVPERSGRWSTLVRKAAVVIGGLSLVATLGFGVSRHLDDVDPSVPNSPVATAGPDTAPRLSTKEPIPESVVNLLEKAVKADKCVTKITPEKTLEIYQNLFKTKEAIPSSLDEAEARVIELEGRTMQLRGELGMVTLPPNFNELVEDMQTTKRPYKEYKETADVSSSRFLQHSF